MDTDQIIRLIESISASGLAEFEYCEGDVKLVLKAAAGVVQPAAGPEVVAAQPAPELQQQAVNPENIIKSPLVGTFYRAPSEDAEPYVAAGDTVKKGQVLGLIETMKLMNEVECDRDGVVTAVLIENEQVVEYGQPLFTIE